MNMFNHLGARNLTMMQQMAAIRDIDRQIRRDWEAGYGVDVDELLERRKALTDAIEKARAA